MTYENSKQLYSSICDQFLFNRQIKEVFAGDDHEEPEGADLVYEIFNDVFGVSIIKTDENNYSIELLSENNELWVTPIKEYFRLQDDDIVLRGTNPIILQTRKRPLEIGCSVGPLVENWRGTLGCFVNDIDNGEKYILSNHHVLYSTSGPNDNFIVQPSVPEGGTKDDAIGLFIRSIPPDEGGINYFDAAVAGPIAMDVDEHIPGKGSKIKGTKTPSIGMQVIKFGLRTGITYGVIYSIDSAFRLKSADGKVLDYQDQITIIGTKSDFATIDNFSMPGDSGSVILEYGTDMLIGLLFCGNNSELSHANKIDGVFNQLRVSI